VRRHVADHHLDHADERPRRGSAAGSTVTSTLPSPPPLRRMAPAASRARASRSHSLNGAPSFTPSPLDLPAHSHARRLPRRQRPRPERGRLRPRLHAPGALARLTPTRAPRAPPPPPPQSFAAAFTGALATGGCSCPRQTEPHRGRSPRPALARPAPITVFVSLSPGHALELRVVRVGTHSEPPSNAIPIGC
jgi:hypothetical protein